MTVQINYKSSNSKKISSNLVLFVDEKFNISGLKKHISNSELSYILNWTPVVGGVGCMD